MIGAAASAANRGCGFSGVRDGGAAGRKPSPSEASRSETKSPNTPAGSATGLACAYSALAGSGVGMMVRMGIFGKKSSAGVALPVE